MPEKMDHAGLLVFDEKIEKSVTVRDLIPKRGPLL